MNIDDIENKYYFDKIQLLVNDACLFDKYRSRLNDELEIINRGYFSKKLYLTYEIVQKIKQDKKHYIIRGTLGDLLVSYLLGINRISPLKDYPFCEYRRLKYDLPYQVAIGIQECPKIPRYEIVVGNFYQPIIEEYVQGNQNDLFPIHSLDRLDLLDRLSSIEDNSFFDSEKWELGWNKLRNDIMNKEHDFYAYEEEYEMFRNYDLKELYWLLIEKLNSKYNTSQLNDKCELIFSREDIWHIIDQLQLTALEKYNMFNEIYLGKGVTISSNIRNAFIKIQDNKELNEGIIESLKSIYTFPISHAIEYLESEIELAYYKEKYPSKYDEQLVKETN